MSPRVARAHYFASPSLPECRESVGVEDPNRCLRATEAASVRLPDPDAILRLHVVRVALLHVERRVPGVDVAERGERADGAGRVRVRREELTKRVVPDE